MKPNPLAGFGGVGCGVLNWRARHRLPQGSQYIGLWHRVQTAKKKAGRGKVFVRGAWLGKKRRPTSRESRSSFKEKGGKSYLTVFVIKQQACHRMVFLVFAGLAGCPGEGGWARKCGEIQNFERIWSNWRNEAGFMLLFRWVVWE